MNATELRIGNWILLSKEEIKKPYQMDSGYDIYKADESECFDIEGLPLTEEWLLEHDFESWGIKQLNDYEYDIVFCKHNILDGSGDFKVCKNISKYGGETVELWQIVIDHDRIYHPELKHVHALQNLFFAIAGFDI